MLSDLLPLIHALLWLHVYPKLFSGAAKQFSLATAVHFTQVRLKKISFTHTINIVHLLIPFCTCEVLEINYKMYLCVFDFAETLK